MLDGYIMIEVNGHQADQAAMSLLEHEGWGHFTAMQVREGRTRGLDLHLSRLEAAHHDLYGRTLDGQEVRARIRHALGGRPDASVRVYGYWAGLIVTVREPQDMPRRPHSMTAVHFQRPLAGSSTSAAGARASSWPPWRQASTKACWWTRQAGSPRAPLPTSGSGGTAR